MSAPEPGSRLARASRTRRVSHCYSALHRASHRAPRNAPQISPRESHSAEHSTPHHTPRSTAHRTPRSTPPRALLSPSRPAPTSTAGSKQPATHRLSLRLLRAFLAAFRLLMHPGSFSGRGSASAARPAPPGGGARGEPRGWASRLSPRNSATIAPRRGVSPLKGAPCCSPLYLAERIISFLNCLPRLRRTPAGVCC